MISICIPIYNFEVKDLVPPLHAQAIALGIPFEIILIDDASEVHFQEKNRYQTLKGVQYISLQQNIGRAAIRNLFLKYAQYEYLLFLDCDAIVFKNDFVEKYIHVLQEQEPKVVCGGRIYPKEQPKRNKRLRWKYGHKKESQPYLERQKHPNRSFMTNNFMVQKAVLEAIRFDERLAEYGHEDTLFGFELKQRSISITHIDNPILNGDLEENEVFIQKTEKGVHNLKHILRYNKQDKSLIEDITLLRVYYKLIAFRGFILFLFRISKPFIKVMLRKGIVSLSLFDFYKLGVLMEDKD